MTRLARRVKQAFDTLAQRSDQVDWFDWVAILTVLVLLGVSHHPLYVAIVLVFAATMFIWPSMKTSPLLWLGMAGVWLPRLWLRWYENEDHVYFAIYWCVAIGLSLWGAHQRLVLSQSARLLIGLCFAIGALWKIASPEFFDGSLFHYKLLYDYRFRQLMTVPVGGLTAVDSEANLTALCAIRSVATQAPAAEIEFPQRVGVIAYVMTAWTILIESLIAVAFLLPLARGRQWIRHASLLLFIVTTYLIVPVVGFAGLFGAMGIATCRPNQSRWRLAYLLATAVVMGFFSLRGTLLPAPG